MKIKELFKKHEILWIIIHPKYQVNLHFELKGIFKWLIIKLMEKRKIKFKLINKNKLRGYSANNCFVDEL